ncbi:alpha/beta hydrolase [Henriciella litoralis]|uniref:alpha/beta hydrolase n=1 Tax=Henriciella litoralis TaxID=568102 RepID=UPI0009FBDB4E|nr:alpha/beta hydrolase [Henriciella litoralis]
MRRILLIIAGIILAGAAAGIVFAILQPKMTMHHPDFGNDCTDLLDETTENAVDCVRVFYGTNREVLFAVDDTNGPAENDTVDVRPVDSGSLSVGRADIWLPKLVEEGGSRDRGETPFLKGTPPEEPSELAKYALITRITKAGTDYFLQQLDDALIDENSYSLLLFVHGFNTPFEDALIRSAQLSVDLSRRDVFDVGVPVLFSWPSAGKVSLGDYKGDRDRSLAAAPHLEAFLELLTANADVDRINIVAHSMGNRVLTKALEDFANDYVEKHGDSGIEFRIVLVAADVDRDIFDATTGILDNLEANITIYTSDADKALQVSNIVNRKMRLGDTDGDKPYIRENNFYETVDATGVATELFGLGHNYYSDNPFILGDMLCAMAEANPETRALERRRYGGTPDGLEYFRVNAAHEPVDKDCSLFRDAFPLTKVSQLTPSDRKSTPSPRTPPPPPEPTETAPPPGRDLEPAALPPSEITLYVEDRDNFEPAALAPQFMPVLAQNEVSIITIRAHTDTVGSEAENLARTIAWADALKAYIVEQTGLSPSFILAEGRGDTQPAVATPDETDELQNRRIELIVEFE